ncbi:flavodoxin family protein [Maridesulfovibrio hydrothermalis]|uniref:NADPH-dependent FMN reductase n=1 Tax=Maridesulfovibrio hydrothermalis AM13 = DSM 14728 TaxID=1121451 RepID=L0R9S9_9BACT|nr:flavodoxin family protein [Maridesulfovibrio hydrothermalis]CCO22346.1 NADPH-dependent FMN reductase [Maridesulfovibrio hydrothermalis AM13 = DSM 14728]
MKQLPVIFACSHHRKGNSDYAAALFLEGIRKAGGDAELIYLGDMDFKHCTGCLKCRTADNHRCIFARKDEAQDLYNKIMTAPFTFFTAPIYFYHLPSRLKTFIDRGQWAFEAKTGSSQLINSLPVRPAYSCLVAGRPKGEKLFEGAELSLRFFLKFFKSELHSVMTFKGIDSPQDLQNDQGKCTELIEAGNKAWKRSVKSE